MYKNDKKLPPVKTGDNLPNSTEVFGPPLKFLDPPMCSHFEPWEPLVGPFCRLLGRLSEPVNLR